MPPLFDIPVERIQYDARGQQLIVLTAATWHNVSYNHAKLIFQIERYQYMVDTYMLQYYPAPVTSE